MVPSNTGGSLAPQHPFNYQPWFDNARRLKNPQDLVAKLEIASVHSVEQAE